MASVAQNRQSKKKKEKKKEKSKTSDEALSTFPALELMEGWNHDREMILFIYFLHDFLLPVGKRRSSEIPEVNEIPVLSHYNTSLPPPPPQGSSTKDYFLQRTMQSLERYFYLIVFNAYLHQQVNASRRFSASSRLFKISAANRLSEVSGSALCPPPSQCPLAFATSFSQWMCCHAWIYRLLARMNLSELSAPAELVTKGARVLVRNQFSRHGCKSTS